MIYIDECDEEELEGIELGDGLSEIEAETIFHRVSDEMMPAVKNMVYGEVYRFDRDDIELFAFDAEFDYISDVGKTYPSMCEMELLYNEANGSVIYFSLTQTDNVEYDHTEEYHDLLDSISFLSL